MIARARPVFFIMVLLEFILLPDGARAEGPKPRLKGASLVAPLLIDHEKEDTAWIFPNSDPSAFFIESEALLNVTKKYLPPTLQSRLEAAARPEGVISVRSIEEAQIQVQFDEVALDVHLSIPPVLRARNDINLKPYVASGKDVIGPAPYSGYLNLRGSQGFQFADGSQGGNERLPATANLQLINNFQGFVLETGADYQEQAYRSVRRSDTRAVKDDESRVMRYAFGDLQLETSGFQSVQSVGGFSATRNFSIAPYETTKPLNRTEIFLKRPSTVEIYVNGLFVQRLQLPAGPFNLQDYPLAVGRNDVQLRVTDDLGQIEQIDLSVLFDNQLLTKGLQQFSYSFGLVSSPTAIDRQYDSSNFLASMFHRVGLTDRFTMGANLQRDRFRTLLGLESYWATWAGMLIGDFASSRDSGAIHGNGARLRYQSLEKWGSRDAHSLLSADVEYDGQNFGPPGTPNPTSSYAWKVDSYLTEKLPWQLRAGAGYQYLVSRTESPNRRIAQLDLSKNWSPTLQTGLNYSVTSDAVTEHRVFASLSWSDGVHRNNFQGTYDSVRDTSRFDWFRQPEKPYDDVRVDVGAQHSVDADQVDARADYVGNRAELSLDHKSTLPESASPIHRTSLSFGSALVWTNKSVAISRPVAESFVLIHDPVGSGVSIPVNDNGSYSETKVNWYGPGVLPGLISYYEQPVNFSVGALPDGYSVGREYQVARPTYKSGVDIALQIRASAVAVGKMVLPEGSPARLESGELVRVESAIDKSRVEGAFVASFFTNDRGQYFVEGLEAGKYEFRFYDRRWKPVRIEIKKDQVGIVRMDPIQLERL